MEVACSLDEFAQVLAEDGYINDQSYFNDATDLPSMLRVLGSSDTVLDSPESFPESPCSDEDIARVLEITQMSSPSLLESCISDSFVQLPSSFVGDVLDPGSVNVTKTRDPCITNAVLHDVFSNKTSTNYNYVSGPCRPTSLPNDLCLHSTIFNNSVSVNLNSIIDAKENDMINTDYFDSTPMLSPISEIDHVQHTPSTSQVDHIHDTSSSPSYLEQTHQILKSETEINGGSASLPFGPISGSGNGCSIQEIRNTSDSQSKSSAQKRKRKRKSFTKSSKSKKGKSKNSNPSPKQQQQQQQQPKPKSKPKPKKAKLSNENPAVEPCIPKTTTKPEASNPLQEYGSTNEKPDSSDDQTSSNPQEGTTLRRSSRSKRNPENYNFRPSSLVKRVQTERRQVEPKQPKGKAKPPPLSKYRRRTANARERDRMKEINDAFDMLKMSLPEVEEDSKQKTTKFTILKLALNYISALSDMLGYDSSGSPSESTSGESSNTSKILVDNSDESEGSTTTDFDPSTSSDVQANVPPTFKSEVNNSLQSFASTSGLKEENSR